MLNAKFTMCFKDVYTIDPNLFDEMEMSSVDRLTNLIKMLKAKYDIYEISAETIPEFKLFLTNTFNQWVFYYEQMLDAYEEEFDWKLGDVESVDITHDNDNTRTITPRAQVTTTTTPGVTSTTEDYDLPRSTSTENRPSSKSVVTPTGYDTVTSGGVEGEDTVVDDGTRTKQGTRSHVNLVEQREKFLKAIRNLYSEFADKFKPCFLDMFM